jgi:hypothetical protein
MPNDVTSVVMISGHAESLQRFHDELLIGETPFDFSKIIPIPIELQPDDMYDFPLSDNGRLNERQIWALAATGFKCRYDWCWDRWGTKWSAYNVSVDICLSGEIALCFDTAWHFPEPIFLRLEEMFPFLIFSVKYFDEGWNFAGRGEYGKMKINPCVEFEPTSEFYEEVYGEPYVTEEEEDDDEEDDDEEDDDEDAIETDTLVAIR